MSDRYQHIRDLDPSKFELTVQYRLTEDLSKIGGPVTVLRLFEKQYSLNEYVPAEAAEEVRAYVSEMTTRADELSAKHGFKNLIRVD